MPLTTPSSPHCRLLSSTHAPSLLPAPLPFLPAVEDMQTLDGLWKAASGGKFGYSVQREMWLQARKQWPKFFKAIDWVQGENNVYR